MADSDTNSTLIPLLTSARAAARALGATKTETRNSLLSEFTRLLEENAEEILRANQRDLAAQKGKLSEALYQRLALDGSKLATLAKGIRAIAALPDPVGRILEKTLLDEGLLLEKVSVPLGVVAVVFESRPDVMPQILSLALKSGNAVLLKGGAEAIETNRAFFKIAAQLKAPRGWLTFLETREQFQELLNHPGHIDLVIPRGSNALVRSIMDSTRIPVLGHADGICHLFVHRSADVSQAIKIAIDAKAQYPAACNSIETLLVDEPIAKEFLPAFAAQASKVGIVLKGCEKTLTFLPSIAAAGPSDYGVEFGNLTLAVKVVQHIEEAVAHINTLGSHHTDAIAAEDQSAIEQFFRDVDSAGVYANASTRFADGYRYGFGAEVGISTSRIHARGPVGLDGLTTYTYRLRGSGQGVSEYTGPTGRAFLHKRLFH